MEIVELNRGDGTTCKIHLFGATITSWTVNNCELIFVSKNAVFDNKKAIRGGIPFCFPVFGPWTSGLPQHGFARTSVWAVTSPPSTDDSGNVSTTLSLSDSDQTRSVWDHHFTLNYTITLTEKQLKLEVEVINNNPDNSLDFTMALHTYIKVEGVEKAVVTGLEGTNYLDKTLEGVPTLVENRKEVTLAGWTDRVYRNTGPQQVVAGVSGNGELVLTKTGLSDTVVWNPWQEKAAAMSDLGGDQWPGFLCVEVGECCDKISVGPGEKWSATHSLEYRNAK